MKPDRQGFTAFFKKVLVRESVHPTSAKTGPKSRRSGLWRYASKISQMSAINPGLSKWGAMEKLVNKIKAAYGADLNIEVVDESICFTHPATEIEISLSKDELDKTGSEEEAVTKVLEMLTLNYVSGECLFDSKYFEAIVSISGSHYVDLLSHYDVNLSDENAVADAPHYEISPASEEFCTFFDGESAYDYVEGGNLTTIKLYNTDKLVGFDKAEEYIEVCKNLCKNTIFDICRKTSHAFELLALSQDDDDPYFELTDELEAITRTNFSHDYDKDLINYYYRGARMESSEFKYLCFYQVLECIFDEVFLHETTQDVKALLNSNWFDPRKDDHAQKIISIVDRYNKEKNDKAKLFLVLQKYFRGDTHDDAYIAANAEIIEILKKLEEVKKDDDIKDLQKLVTVIYDFRCSCTHSNRKFPKASIPHTDDSLDLYISLVKKVAEAVIINYR